LIVTSVNFKSLKLTFSKLLILTGTIGKKYFLAISNACVEKSLNSSPGVCSGKITSALLYVLANDAAALIVDSVFTGSSQST
jgi:hypothetical protein